MLEAHYCKKCGKEFYPTPEHVYKDHTGMYCCWTCFDYHRKNTEHHRKPVEVLEHGVVVATYRSARFAAKVFSCDEQSIRQACRENKFYKGYRWRYADENKENKL